LAKDPERDRPSGRLGRFAKVGLGLSGAAAAYGTNLVFGGQEADMRNAKALRAARVSHEYVVVAGAPHTFDLHPKGKSWKRTGLIAGAEVSSSSPEADITQVTLAFLARTIGK
jgi:acetyl esterase/lipase